MEFSSLPAHDQEAYLAREQSAAQLLAGFSPELRDAFKIEAARRRALLESASKFSHILDRWPTTDPLILAARPSWGARPCERTLRRAAAEVARDGSLALLPRRPFARRTGDRRLRRVPDEIGRTLISLWLVERRDATFTSVRRELIKRFGVEVPSIKVLRAYLRRNVSHGAEVLGRKGPKTFQATVQSPILRDRSELEVYEILSGDHHEFDVMVINPERDGQLDRPWLTMWLDEASRAPAGWVISFAPNSRTIKQALSHAIRPKPEPARANLCGRPASIYIDNGKDFRADCLESVDAGLFTNLCIKIMHARPYNAKAKIVERFFGTLCLQFSKDQPGYCAPKASERTELHQEDVKKHERWLESGRGESPFMTLATFVAKFSAWVLEYMALPHRGLKEAATGRVLSPADVVRFRNPARIVAVPEQNLLFLLKDRVVATVQKSLLRIGGFAYRHDALLLHERQKLECYVDKSDLRRVDVFTQAGKFVCAAECVELLRISASAVDARVPLEINRQKREMKKARALLDSAFERELDGRTLLEEAIDARPPPAPEPVAPLALIPEDAARDFRPAIDRRARDRASALEEAAERAAEALPPPSPDDMPAAIVVDRDARDLELVLAEIGERPEAPHRLMSETRQALLAELFSDWEALLTRKLAERRAARSVDSSIDSPGGPPHVSALGIRTGHRPPQ